MRDVAGRPFADHCRCPGIASSRSGNSRPVNALRRQQRGDEAGAQEQAPVPCRAPRDPGFRSWLRCPTPPPAPGRRRSCHADWPTSSMTTAQPQERRAVCRPAPGPACGPQRQQGQGQKMRPGQQASRDAGSVPARERAARAWSPCAAGARTRSDQAAAAPNASPNRICNPLQLAARNARAIRTSDNHSCASQGRPAKVKVKTSCLGTA